jgi:hypothetical protein
VEISMNQSLSSLDKPAFGNKAMFSSRQNAKKIQDFPSHRMCWHMYGALNISKK